MHLKGTITALITPFIDQQLDEEGLADNIHFQIAQGVDGILLLGTTGEHPTLTQEEQIRAISIARKIANGKVSLWVGTGSNSTQQTIINTQRAKELGADIALIVTPYYNKPTQEGLFRHYEAIANQVDIPIVVYNNPTRTGINLETQTLVRMAQLSGIAGFKDSSGNIDQVGEMMHALRQANPACAMLSGDDVFTFPMMMFGASGVISVVSNLVPSRVVSLVKALSEKRYDEAREMHFALLPLFKAAFLETNPVPIKTAMQLCGMAAGGCRLPLCEMQPQHVEILRAVLESMQLETSK